MVLFVCYRIIECILYYLVIHYNFVDDLIFFECFKRPVKGRTIVVASQTIANFVFRQCRFRRHNYLDNSFPATCPFQIVTY